MAPDPPRLSITVVFSPPPCWPSAVSRLRGDEVSEQEQWQLDGGAPELYQRYLVPAITALWAADLADRAALRQGERVLDVACGTGVGTAYEAARTVRSGAR